jgi:hypothetical protein
LGHVIKPGDTLEKIIMKHPDFSDFSYRKNGSLKSFAYGPKRVRLDTLRGFLVDLLGDLAPPLVAPPAPALPAPLVPALLPSAGALSSPEPDATEALTRFRQRPRVQSRKNKPPTLEVGLS